MYKIQFLVGLPYQNPPQQIAEAVTLHDDAEKAVAEAKAKAEFILQLLAQRPQPPAEKGKRVPRLQKIVGLEIRLTADDGQITLLETPKPKRQPPAPDVPEWRPSGDYRAQILLKFGESMIGLGDLQFASTTASRALSMATERARELIAQLKKEPKLAFIRFQDIKIEVERINTQVTMFGDRPDFDWRHMEFPTPHF